MPEQSELPTENFLELLATSLRELTFEKLLLSKYRGEEVGLQRLAIRPVNVRNEPALSFVYSFKTRDITKNLAPEVGLEAVRRLLATDYKSAHLLTRHEETQWDISKRGKVAFHTRKLAPNAIMDARHEIDHDRQKQRYVDIRRPFLSALGVTNAEQQLIPAMSRKWKQINKFIEVFSHALEQSALASDKPVRVVDFGSGKGYLTFAVHDFLRHSLQRQALVTGVELRAELVDLGNAAAAKLDHEGLHFTCGDIKTHAPDHTDVMIALHACDTATDYAIHYGIRAGAAIIMCSPCCHKQLRGQLQSPALLKPLLQYGVHLGQEAEMLTDTLRALLLEANGYSAKVFEFISLEHTSKNKMILAVKKKNAGDNKAVLTEIAALKAFYGINEHCLEQLLG